MYRHRLCFLSAEPCQHLPVVFVYCPVYSIEKPGEIESLSILAAVFDTAIEIPGMLPYYLTIYTSRQDPGDKKQFPVI